MEDEKAYLVHVQRHPLCIERQLLHKVHEEVYPVFAHLVAKLRHPVAARLVAKQRHPVAVHLVAVGVEYSDVVKIEKICSCSDLCPLIIKTVLICNIFV